MLFRSESSGMLPALLFPFLAGSLTCPLGSFPPRLPRKRFNWSFQRRGFQGVSLAILQGFRSHSTSPQGDPSIRNTTSERRGKRLRRKAQRQRVALHRNTFLKYLSLSLPLASLSLFFSVTPPLSLSLSLSSAHSLLCAKQSLLEGGHLQCKPHQCN